MIVIPTERHTKRKAGTPTHAYEFMKDRVGEENIFAAVVHMDEATPHMHLCFVPLTRDKRLSAKEILGNKADMRRWQDEFHAHMSAKWPELERGEPAAETQRKHQTAPLAASAICNAGGNCGTRKSKNKKRKITPIKDRRTSK